MEITPVYQKMNEMFEEVEIYHHIPKGKGIRAQLVLHISPDAVSLAAAIESIHLASLLHDDVIDKASTRRGKKSINYLYGDEMAILVGDIFFSKALQELIPHNPTSATALAHVIYNLSMGEIEDVNLSKQMNLNKDKYMNMIYKKTACLIEMACKEAARLANLDIDTYAKYGKHLGLVFQIIDDILDIVSDEATLGKPVMNDLKEGKMTLPFIYMYEQLNQQDKQYFRTLFKKQLTDKEIDWIKHKIQPAIIQTYNEASKLAHDGIQNIKDQYLQDLMLKLINRKF
ncbi:MAG: polyprenyl synthetase family protein [Epsilonproteobacteria bacterium]|nr:polyprenyl synthetase family protein [Campylobacterota bacterium]